MSSSLARTEVHTVQFLQVHLTRCHHSFLSAQAK